MIGFDLYVETSNRTDHTNGPIFIRVHVDSEFLARTIRRSDFCNAEKLKNTTNVQSPASWDASNQDVYYWELFVDTEKFWFHGAEDEGGELISSSHGVSIELLKNYLPGHPSFEGDDDEAVMRWIGGSLIYSDYEIDQFSEVILEKCPEVAAKECELMMAARLSESGIVAGESVKSTTRPRRTL